MKVDFLKKHIADIETEVQLKSVDSAKILGILIDKNLK